MSTGTLGRCVALGMAAGMRSSWGLAGPVLTGSAGSLPRLAAAVAVAGETAADKHPAVPDRLSAVGLAPRLLSGAAGAWVLARRGSAAPPLPLLVAAAGVVAGSLAGVQWRAWAADRIPDWQGALIEDAVAATLALGAGRGTRPAARAWPLE
uniref:DUF4126 domain-containing protein n=1 Tax=uncultured Nocardioidaceae bacterium TaxID=253824 RepID=A0A6J4MH95_9ACTN|nr:MAG: hypothetical protein AVDCRST_MAG46-3026 [uncultured Nocardioidaceae bacterium]